MVIYIESVFAFNVLVDYLLLFGAASAQGGQSRGEDFCSARRSAVFMRQCSSFCRKASFCCCLGSL